MVATRSNARQTHRMANKDNPGAGKRFELAVQKFLQETQNLNLKRPFAVNIGTNEKKRPHLFDLGSEEHATVVECKAHSWTAGGNSPSAKLAVWNEAMYYFSLTPNSYRKLFFVKLSLKRDVSLFKHYVGRFSHLIPVDLEIWEFNEITGHGECKYRNAHES